MTGGTLWGRDPWGHHLTSIVLHAAATGLCYLVFAGWTGASGRSALVAALFGMHPLRVESVAWIAERKDVLAAFWWMVALLAYGAWVRRRTAGRYAAVVAAFACALLAKPMVVTLPFVLLLLGLWPLDRWSRARAVPLFPGRGIILEKLPFFALSAAASVLAVYAQASGGAMGYIIQFPLSPLSRKKASTPSRASWSSKTIFWRRRGRSWR